jgi:hypothetical protein
MCLFLVKNGELYSQKLYNFATHLVLLFRYHLAGAICPKSHHFTATIVRSKGRYSKYDDLSRRGVRDDEGGDDLAETAIYVIEIKKY